MTIYTFHKTDLLPDAPRVLPAPLVAGAVFLSGSFPNNQEVEAFLDQHGIGVGEPRNIWMCCVWDANGSDITVAQAAYSWQDGRVVRDALHVEPGYDALGLESFLDGMGSALFGARDVHIPVAA